MIGTTLYTVSRTLSQWEQVGIVATGRERIRICRPDALEQLAGEAEPFSQTCLSPCALVELMMSRRHTPATPA
jgi:DNA-binding transcriptional regulator YhcF (GntR family)